MDKGLTVPKWVQKVRPKIPPMPQNLSAQIVCPIPNIWDFDEFHLVSIVCDLDYLHGHKKSLHFDTFSFFQVYTYTAFSSDWKTGKKIKVY